MATPIHEVGTLVFDHGSYAEFDFTLYDYDGTVFSVQASDKAYVKIGTNGVAAVMTVRSTATTGGSVTVLTTGTTGIITLQITATDSGSTLSATTYDFQAYLIDASDNSNTKYFCRGKFKVESTIL